MALDIFIKFFEPVSIVGLVFWAGYAYRRLISQKEALNSLTKNQEQWSSGLAKLKILMHESDNKTKTFARGLVDACASNKVQQQDLAVLEVKFENVIENQNRIKKQLDDFIGRFDDFAKHYYERNSR